MIKKGRHTIKNHMTLEYAFNGIRIRDSKLTPVEWYMSIDMAAPLANKKGKDTQLNLANIAYKKIYFWLDANLQHTVIVDVTNETDLYIANMSSNIMLYCPYSANDDVLSQVLHAKIFTLAGQNLMVGAIYLKASDTALQYTYDCPQTGYSIPSHTKDYYKVSTCRDDTPWWFRDDGFCFEFARPDDTDLTDEELFGGIQDPLGDFWDSLNQIEENKMDVPNEQQEVLRVEKWKPKII